MEKTTIEQIRAMKDAGELRNDPAAPRANLPDEFWEKAKVVAPSWADYTGPKVTSDGVTGIFKAKTKPPARDKFGLSPNIKRMLSTYFDIVVTPYGIHPTERLPPELAKAAQTIKRTKRHAIDRRSPKSVAAWDAVCEWSKARRAKS